MDRSELNDEKEPPQIAVAVLDHGECRLGAAVEYDASLDASGVDDCNDDDIPF